MIETVKALLATDIGAYIAIGTALVTAASGIANLTPNQTDDKVVGYLVKAINWTALNIAKKS